MLQRIYGTAFFKKDELAQHLERLEEARKRDHRVLGKQLDLFLFHPFAPGAAFWTDRGTVMINEINQYLRELQRDGYHEIRTPLLFNKALWEMSGHWGKYRENMFLVLDNETGEHDISLKPMNCPSHYLMYLSRKHSYRELPLRYCTYDVLHRNEVSGTLSGLTRVRQFQQDDCHIFLMDRQIQAEVHRLTQFILKYYATFGLKATLKFATRPPERIGSDALWDEAERSLRHALEATGLRVRTQGGGRRVLRPQDRFRRRRRHRAEMAAGHHPARLQRSRAVRPQLCRRGQHDPPPGGDPSRGERIVRAVHGDPDRALRRGVPALARAGTGADSADQRRAARGGASR